MRRVPASSCSVLVLIVDTLPHQSINQSNQINQSTQTTKHKTKQYQL
jgi:hypothetical protein